ncbi:GroES-like protein [Echria macrotheca]|uniref:GroES-like protein n=1 Tax=Echria macrotheca TaxID=438768 RepID=A0AAJ0FDU0_9PEZI|nr:GroES-like protein [Echria macrotheca]
MSSPDESFKALYLPDTGKPFIKTIPRPYTPTGSQSLVKVKYSAINPGDIRHFYMGYHSFVMGYEFTGDVISTGPDAPFRPGDAVMGITMPGHQRPIHAGAHQAYLLANPYMVWLRPDDFDLLTAVRMPGLAQTAADALFNVLGFAFPPLGMEGIDPADQAVLIWGGAGAVGWASIQLAKAAGIRYILVTASKANLELVRDAGATHVFDYRAPDVVDQVRGTVKELGVELEAVIDAVAVGLGIFERPGTPVPDYSKSTAAIAKSCLSDEVVKSGRARLAAVLPVPQDPDWDFALYSRKHDADQERDHPGWWQKQEKIVTWLVENHKQYWKSLPPPKIIRNAEEALQGMEDAFTGKQGVQKLVIEHPML